MKFFDLFAGIGGFLSDYHKKDPYLLNLIFILAGSSRQYKPFL